MSDPPVVAVVGGGIAGLAAAWELAGAGTARVVVVEADDRVGGKIGTATFADRPVELGADAFLTRRPEAVDLCQQIGIGDELVAPATGLAYVSVGGRLRRFPSAMALGVPTRLGPLARSLVLSPAGVARAALDAVWPWQRRSTFDDAGHDAAIGDLVGRRLGRQVVDRLADPLIGGIHAGGVAEMSAAAVFPVLLEAASRPGSLMRNLRRASAATTPSAASSPVFLGVRGGMGTMVARLADALGRRGTEIRTSWPVTHIERGERWRLRSSHGDQLDAEALVVAVPSFTAGRLLEPIDPHLSALLSSISYSSVVLVTMLHGAGDVGPLPPGSGFLVPRVSGGTVTACTWVSSKWPALAHDGEVLVRVSMGRHGDERAMALDDEALVRAAVDELAGPMGVRNPPLDTMVVRFPDAFPQYMVGHLAKVALVEQGAARAGGLALAGAAMQGVGIPACIASGRRAARAVTSHLEDAPWR